MLQADAVTAILLTLLLLACAVVDLRTRLIFDWLTLPGIMLFLVLRACTDLISLLGGLEGFALLGGIAWLMAALSRGQLGGGDIKLLAAIGMALGPRSGADALVWTYLLAGVAAWWLLLHRRLKRWHGTGDTEAASSWSLPMGPFIAAGTLLVIWI